MNPKWIALAALFSTIACNKLKPAPYEGDPAASATSPTSTAAAAPQGARSEFIRDATLDMDAVEIKVPSDWHFEGKLFQSGSCVPTPFGVHRETSRDGLSFREQLPVLGWRWGSGPFSQANKDDCLPLTSALSAQDFLKYISSTLDVEYVADEPVPQELEDKAQSGLAAAQARFAPKYAAQGLTPPKETRELARAIVKFTNGTFPMKGRLTTMVDCTETVFAGMKSILRGIPDRPASTVHHCQASVNYIAAPESDYARVVAMLDSPAMESPGTIPAWGEAWMARSNRQAAAMMQQMNAQTQAAMRASANQFAHDQAVRQRMHEQFLATMQRGTNMSMARAAQVANSNHRAAQDWVDYSLDRQTVRDPTTGQVSKVSNASSYTWVDSTGKTSFQTNDVNANPNGALQGTWTRQVVTHADGTN